MIFLLCKIDSMTTSLETLAQNINILIVVNIIFLFDTLKTLEAIVILLHTISFIILLKHFNATPLSSRLLVLQLKLNCIIPLLGIKITVYASHVFHIFCHMQMEN